jgi:hypothetical protein
MDGDWMIIGAASRDRILEACEHIFGSDVRINEHFLRYLQHSGLKAAYRKRVKQLHPDSAGGDGETFILIKESYDLIQSFLINRDKKLPDLAPFFSRAEGGAYSGKANRRTRPWKPQEHTRAPGHSRPGKPADSRQDHYYRGHIPPCSLRFGQYLYYCGRISWKMLIDAVCWQKNNRPTFGTLAADLGYIDSGGLSEVIRQKSQGEFIGDTALRLGLMTDVQVRTVLFRQNRFNLPIGRYFLKEGLLSHVDITRCLNSMELHNSKYR